MRLGVTLVPLNLYLDTRPATCVGQFFCEAALNAIKHGFPDGSSGHVMTNLRSGVDAGLSRFLRRVRRWRTRTVVAFIAARK
jgi:two-component sensor histidine kinase